MESKPKRSKPKITSLPQELITAILVRLPVKNILLCKSVSKYWLSLISSPLFVKTHLKFSAKDVRMLLRPSRERIIKHCSVHSLFNHHFIDESYLENPDPFVRIVGSLPFTETFDLDNPLYNLNRSIAFVVTVNGLICLRSWRGRLILWNPSTREVRPVHDLIPPDTNGLFNSYTFMYGFGYDEVHDDYKIVAIYKNGPAIGLICSLKNTSWRNLDVFEHWLQYDQSAKFVNGKVHWVSGTTFTIGGDSFIMSIDLVDEKCGKVELPNYEEGEKELDLGVLGSDLSISCNHIKDHQRTRIDVWVMKEYVVKESWMKLYSIKYCTFSGCYLTAPPLHIE